MDSEPIPEPTNEIPAKKFIPIEERFQSVVDNTVAVVGTPSMPGCPDIVMDTEYGLITREEMSKVNLVLKKNYPQMLKEALIRQYVRRGKHLIDHAVEVAYEDNNVLIALMKKIVPDKTGIEVNFNLSKEDREEIASRLKLMVEERKAMQVSS